MPGRHTEAAFESAIEEHLVSSGGYTRGDRDAFDPERCIDAGTFLAFVRETQPKQWEYLRNLQKEKAGAVLLDDLCRAMNSEHEGCLSVLRHGFKCFGKLFHAAYFAPASGMNPETQRLYAANRLTITRQLRYSNRHGNTLDVVLGLNGIPVATAELKNPMTGQTWRDAVRQYKHDRDPTDLIFQFRKRALVHFAVDPDEVYMTTRLAGRNTHFLPFNKGCAGGAGNPANPGGRKTAYLWEEVLERHSFLDILARFVHLQIEEKRLGGRKVQRETMIFPRYHQLDCVRKLVADARANGAGTNYLVQHSAGSGKSNSIAWLAHRLASLYNAKDEKVFDSIVIVTDRVVLDQQLQNTVYQFEHKQGVVRKIDVDSAQLASALGAGVPIVITTLQKFPFVTEKIGDLPRRRYAVIIDEAHSSQGGENAIELKGVLGGAAIKEEARRKAEEEGLPDYEEEILRTMVKRGRQPNISFFAFTATPKYKTLEMFGRPGADGKPQPFHLYSMRQAIEEGFILIAPKINRCRFSETLAKGHLEWDNGSSTGAGSRPALRLLREGVHERRERAGVARRPDRYFGSAVATHPGTAVPGGIPVRAEEAMVLDPCRRRIERIDFDLKVVLNPYRVYAANPNAVAMQVYAGALVSTAMRGAQAEVAAQAGINPEEISPATRSQPPAMRMPSQSGPSRRCSGSTPKGRQVPDGRPGDLPRSASPKSSLASATTIAVVGNSARLGVTGNP